MGRPDAGARKEALRMNGPSFGWLNAAAPVLTAPEPPLYPDTLNAGTIDPATGQVSAPIVPPPGEPPPMPATPQNVPPTPADVGVPPPPPVAPGPAPAPPPAQPVAAPAPEAAPPPEVQFRQVGGGGVVPAHEAYVRGPQQDTHLLGAFEPPLAAAAGINERNQAQVAREDAFYASQAEQAARQQDVAQAVLAKRQAELQQIQADYQDQVAKLGEMHLDTNRWWANKSVPSKIATILLTTLGGIGAGKGLENLAYQRTLKNIDDDVKAQMFDYQTGLEQAKGLQSAYGMMLQRYGSEDAAQAAVRAAGIDYAIAKANQLKAQWGGVDSANKADAFIADMLAKREETIANGFRFVPAAASQPRYTLRFNGVDLPGTFTEKEAQERVAKYGVEPVQKADQSVVEGGVQALVQDRKAAAEARVKGQENAVVLPTGETVYPTSPVEAKEIRDLATSSQNVKRLVGEAKQIREGSAFRASPTARARLSQIQAELLTDFGVQHKLGALSDKDYAIAQQGTANLFDIGSPVEAQLDALQRRSSAKLTDRVKTIPGADKTAPRNTGTMPASFTQHGGK